MLKSTSAFIVAIALLSLVSCSRHSRVSHHKYSSQNLSSFDKIGEDHSFLVSDHKKVRDLFKWFEQQMELKEDKVKSHEKLLSRYQRLKDKFYRSQKNSVRRGLKAEMLQIRNDIDKDHALIMANHEEFMEEIIRLVAYKRKLTGTIKVD